MDSIPKDFAPEQTLVPDPDPVAQWLDWEQQANLVGFRTSTEPLEIDVVEVPREELEIQILPGASEAIVRRFLRGDRVCFPRHPLNRDSSVAWFDATPSERWTARFTSSRTLALPGPESGDLLTSLKLATDHPHPHFLQPEKTQLREEAIDAVRWVRTLARVDRLLPTLEGVGLITEVLVILAAGRESGVLVRDLSRFQDGNYYLPALSIPWVGRQIARLHGEDFAEFFGAHFAAVVGRAKARLFARYGLWYKTPNPQNVLLQLDRSLLPTGTLLFRDVGDGEFGTDADSALEIPWTRVTGPLRPETCNSFWAFDEAGDHSIDATTLSDWYARHDAAYADELARWFPALAPGSRVPADERLEHWNHALLGDRAPAEIERAFAAGATTTRDASPT